MSTLTPINGWSIPSLTDSPNITSAVNTAINQIDARVNPIFSSTAARDSAISSPTAGQECYVTATKEKYLYTGASWVGLRPRVATKPTSETVNNSSVNQDDNDLFFNVEANSIYNLYMVVTLVSTVAADFKINFIGPASFSYGVEAYIYERDTVTLMSPYLLTNNTAAGHGMAITSTLTHYVFIQGQVVIAGTAGNLQFQWAQGVATAVNTTVNAGSSMALLKIS